MKFLCSTDHLEVFDAGEFKGKGSPIFVFTRRLYVGVPIHDGVTQNMKVMATALVARYPLETGGERVFLDRVDMARPSAEDSLFVDYVLKEFVEAVQEHAGLTEPPTRFEMDPYGVLNVPVEEGDDPEELDLYLPDCHKPVE